MDAEIQAKLSRLFVAIKKEDEDKSADVALGLLGEFLTDVKRIADSLEKIAACTRSED
jgi:hypothetical protein